MTWKLTSNKDFDEVEIHLAELNEENERIKEIIGKQSDNVANNNKLDTIIKILDEMGTNEAKCKS